MNPYTHPASAHLTAEQFGELVDREGLEAEHTAAANHVALCSQCRDELNSLREALALFRETACTFADREFVRSRHVQTTRLFAASSGLSPGILWAAAGLLVLAAAGLPFRTQPQKTPVQMGHHVVSSPAPAQTSDEALLDEINQDVSASVPASMQALQDPTGSAAVTGNDAQTSSARKN